MTQVQATRLGRYLHQAREQRGLTINQASARSHIVDTTLMLLERGHYYEPPVDHLRQLAKAYRISYVDVLLKGGFVTTRELRAWQDAMKRRPRDVRVRKAA